MGFRFNSMILSFVLVSLLYPYDQAAAATYNVVNFGAKADGKTNSGKAFLSAWAAACAASSPATVYAPPGRYLLGNAITFSDCKNHAVTFRIDATVVAPADYGVIGNAANWIEFKDVTGVSVLGGVLDGQGTGLWACKNSGKNCPSGATVGPIYDTILSELLCFGSMEQSSGRAVPSFHSDTAPS